jgi:hypothetical protein
MLGSYLEIGVKTDDIASVFDALRMIGFSEVPVGDIRLGAYAVVSDGAVFVGLHDRPIEDPALTFVRPDVEDYVRALRRLGVELEFAQLGDQDFHEIGFRDPGGQLVTLIEARTFSSLPLDSPSASACGRFVEFSLPASALEESRRFWTALGLEVLAEGDEPQPWIQVAGAGLTIGLHETGALLPGLTFAAQPIDGRVEYLRAKGHSVRRGAPVAARGEVAATLTTIPGLPIYLVGDADSA